MSLLSDICKDALSDLAQRQFVVEREMSAAWGQGDDPDEDFIDEAQKELENIRQRRLRLRAGRVLDI